jgi:hypothetical protein
MVIDEGLRQAKSTSPVPHHGPERLVSGLAGPAYPKSAIAGEALLMSRIISAVGHPYIPRQIAPFSERGLYCQFFLFRVHELMAVTFEKGFKPGTLSEGIGFRLRGDRLKEKPQHPRGEMLG